MTAEDGVGDAKMELPSLRKVTTSAEPSVNAAPEESCGDRLLRMTEKKCNLEQPRAAAAAADADHRHRDARWFRFFFLQLRGSTLLHGTAPAG